MSDTACMAFPAFAPEPSDAAPVVRFWRGIADLQTDRRRALAEIEACFRSGSAPGRLEGNHAGRLVTTTMGPGLDASFGLATRVWMPWQGKTFSPASSDGRNLFGRRFRAVVRLLWPGYVNVRPEGAGGISAFRFLTWDGPSVTDPDLTVLKIDYGHPESPALIIRSVLDELVRVDDGLYLGQALMDWRGRLRRAAWFALSR